MPVLNHLKANTAFNIGFELLKDEDSVSTYPFKWKYLTHLSLTIRKNGANILIVQSLGLTGTTPQVLPVRPTQYFSVISGAFTSDRLSNLPLVNGILFCIV